MGVWFWIVCLTVLQGELPPSLSLKAPLGYPGVINIWGQSLARRNLTQLHISIFKTSRQMNTHVHAGVRYAHECFRNEGKAVRKDWCLRPQSQGNSKLSPKESCGESPGLHRIKICRAAPHPGRQDSNLGKIYAGTRSSQQILPKTQQTDVSAQVKFVWQVAGSWIYRAILVETILQPHHLVDWQE